MTEKYGLECKDNVDGSKVCRRYKLKKSGIYATGTEVELIPDPNTCKVRIVGRINDEDKDAVMNEITDFENRCKKGF